MASRPKKDLSEYPRPWFYRPEIYYGFIIFPPVWSVLTLRSPWHSGQGFRGIMVGGIAWFFIIASVVFAFRWVQADDEGNRRIVNLFIFVPGLLLTLVTQIQWAAHRAQHGPPPTEAEEEPAPAPESEQEVPVEPAMPGDESPDGAGGDESEDGETSVPDYSPRRRRRRRRRPPGTRSADSSPLC